MQIVRWLIGAALFLALLFLSLQNSDLVTLKFYHWWSWQAPLIFVVLVAFAVGVAAGLLAGVVRTTRLKRQISRLRREQRLREPTPAAAGTPAGVPGRRTTLVAVGEPPDAV
jgi:lipopolysaccharide assembly protein A